MRLALRRLLLMAYVGGSVLHAQDASTGALQGEIDGPDGRPIPGATVSLRDADDRNFARTVAVASDGRYQIYALPPGRYMLSAQAKGFASDAPSEVTVALGESAHVDLVLRVGLPQSVQVESERTPSPDLFTSPTDTTFSPNEVETLPIEGRRWQDVAALASTLSPADGEETRLSSAGIAVTQNRYTLDGARDTRSFTGEARGSRRLSLGNTMSSVREFRVVTSSTGGDHSGLGATLQVVTRAGSAKRGGSIFLQTRGNLFAAVDPSAIVTRYNGGSPTISMARPEDTRLQWGATLYGALPRIPSVLGHIAYEQEHRSFPAISSPASRTFYVLSAKQTALLQNRGVGIAKQKEALAYLDSLSGTVDRRADEWSLLPRLDWHIGTKSVLSFTWNHASRTAPAGLRGETAVNRGAASFGNDRISTNAMLLRWTQDLSSRMVNRVLFGYSNDLEQQEAQPSLPQEPHTGPNGFSPQVSIGSDFIFGKPSALGRRRYPDEQRIQAGETLSYAAHRWALEAGGNLALVNEQIASLDNEEGTYTYANSAASGRAGALVDWITDWTFPSTAYPNGACPAIFAPDHYFCFRSFTQSYGAQSIAFRTGETSAFAQMRWQPAASLAITAGLRYELFTLPSAQQPNPALDALFGDVATTSQLPRDRNNLAPYASAAWGTRTTVIRLGAGINYGRVAGATVWSALSRTALPGSVRTVRIGPQTIVDTNCASAGSNFGYPSTYICAPSASALRSTSAIMFANNFAMPAIGQAQLSLERQTGRVLMSAAYTGFAARSLPNSTDINIAKSTHSAAFRVQRTGGRGEAGVRNGDTFVLPTYTARVNASFGPVTEMLSNASASHHSLTLAMQRRLHNGWSMRASWTCGKTLDFGPNQGALPLINGQLDPFNVRYDRAPSDLDRRHRVVFSGFYTVSVKGSSWRARAANGWTLSPVFSASAGRPYSYLISGGTSLAGGSDSINGAGGLRYLPSVGRNTLRLPWSENLNLRVARRVRLREILRIEMYADAFNALNSNNVNRVQQRAFLVGDAAGGVTPLIYQDAATVAAEGLTTQPFATRLGSGTLLARQREFQFGLRLEW